MVKHVLLDGRLAPETGAQVSIFDRGFLYGDGLFETLRICRGRLPLVRRHLERLESGLRLLRIDLPGGGSALADQATRLVKVNSVQDGLLRLQVTRGAGPRGYSPRGATRPTVLLTTHSLPAPAGSCPPPVRLITSSHRIWSRSPLNRVKSTAKLLHVLARAEADEAGADDALLLNEDDAVVEASSANLFWIEEGRVLTPPLESGALPGVTRALVLEAAQKTGSVAAEVSCQMPALTRAEAVFLTNSAHGVVEVGFLDGHPCRSSAVVGHLRQAWLERLAD